MATSVTTTTDNMADRLGLIYPHLREVGGTDRRKPASVVPGLIFRVNVEKLKEGLLARAQYHETRAADKEKELPELRKLAEGIEQVSGRLASINPAEGLMGKGGPTNYVGRDTRNSADDLLAKAAGIETDVRNHRNKAISFRFLAECAYDEAEYALTWEDLRTLEFVP